MDLYALLDTEKVVFRPKQHSEYENKPTTKLW